MSNAPKILVVITARGGSKGVPRKNIREIAGKPLIAYAIHAALGVENAVYKVVVSTDDPEIAKIAQHHGAEVPFVRPPELATDNAASLPVVQHAVNTIEKQDGIIIDWCLLIQPTNPLITSEDITNAIALIDDKATSIVSIVNAADSHPLKALKIEDGELYSYIDGAPQAVRRQDLSPVYKRNGSLYMTRRDVLMDSNDLYGSTVKPYIMPEERSIDIDTERDFALANMILQKQ